MMARRRIGNFIARWTHSRVALLVIISLDLVMAMIGEAERRAPTIFASRQPINTCSVSPSSRYIGLKLRDSSDSLFVDTHTGQTVTFPASDTAPRGFYATPYAAWVDDDRQLQYEYSDARGMPLHGWLLDPARRILTDTATLSPATQKLIDTQAQKSIERIAHDPWREWAPNQRALAETHFWSALPRIGLRQITISDQMGHLVNSYGGHVIGRQAQLCSPGWRSDGAGYFFLELSTRSTTDSAQRLRILLVHPEPIIPWWGWLLAAVGICRLVWLRLAQHLAGRTLVVWLVWWLSLTLMVIEGVHILLPTLSG